MRKMTDDEECELAALDKIADRHRKRHGTRLTAAMRGEAAAEPDDDEDDDD